jgi:hypothetical protein
MQVNKREMKANKKIYVEKVELPKVTHKAQ